MNERKKERKKERERERDFGLRMMMGRGKYDVIKHFLGKSHSLKIVHSRAQVSICTTT